MKTQRIQSALAVCMILVLFLTACGASTPPATPTVAFTPTVTHTQTPTLTPTITFTPTNTPLPTATPNLAATEQYANFLPVVQKLYDGGLISTQNGHYQMLGDYTDQSNEAGRYRWNLYDEPVENFVVRADITLETAPAPASQSGCGFVFGFFDNSIHEFAFLQRNGSAIYGMGGRPFTTKYYDKLQNPAEFNMLVIAHKKEIRVFVNDKEVIKIEPGLNRDRKQQWGPAMLIGSTQDFGTRCTFKNIELWEISES